MSGDFRPTERNTDRQESEAAAPSKPVALAAIIAALQDLSTKNVDKIPFVRQSIKYVVSLKLELQNAEQANGEWATLRIKLEVSWMTKRTVRGAPPIDEWQTENVDVIEKLTAKMFSESCYEEQIPRQTALTALAVIGHHLRDRGLMSPLLREALAAWSKANRPK